MRPIHIQLATIALSTVLSSAAISQQAPPYPADPRPDFIRPEFEQPSSNSTAPRQPNNTLSRTANLSGDWAFQDGSKPSGSKRVTITQMGDRLVVTLVSGDWGELSNQNAQLDGKLSNNQVFIHWSVGRAVTPSTGYYGILSPDGKTIKGEFRTSNPVSGEIIRDDPFTMSKL